VLDMDEFQELVRRLMSGFNSIEGLSPSTLAHLKLVTENVAVDEQEVLDAEAGSKVDADQDRGEAGTTMDVSFDATDRVLIGTDPEDDEQLLKAVITAHDTVEIPSGDDNIVVLRLRPEKTVRKHKKKTTSEAVRIVTLSFPDGGQANRWLRALQGVIKFVDSTNTDGGEPELTGMKDEELAEMLLEDAGAGSLPPGIFSVAKPFFPLE
jgi:hypothetical protein